MKPTKERRWAQDSGATAAEYAVLLSMLTGAAVAGMQMIGSTTSAYQQVQIANASATGSNENEQKSDGAPAPSTGSGAGSSTAGGTSSSTANGSASASSRTGGSTGSGTGGSNGGETGGSTANGGSSTGSDTSGSTANNAASTGNQGRPLHDDFGDKGNMSWQYYGGDWQKVDGSLTTNAAWSKAIATVPYPDYTYTVSLRTISGTNTQIWNVTRPVFRYQDAGNYYALVPKANGTLELAKMQGGKWLPWLASGTTGVGPYQLNEYCIQVQGNQINVSVNNKKVLSYTDANPITSGGVGAANDWATGEIADVRVTPAGSNAK